MISMIRKRIFFMLFLVQGLYLFATPQESDAIIYDGKEYKLILNLQFPMETYFNEFPEKRPPAIWTSLWRGYVATFEIIENELWVIKIERYNHSDEPEGRVNITNECLNGNDRMKIYWFNGLFVLPHGERVEIIPHAYASTYEYYKIIEIHNGNFVKELNINNNQFVKFRDRQFEIYKQTEEYDYTAEGIGGNYTEEEIDNFLRLYIHTYLNFNELFELYEDINLINTILYIIPDSQNYININARGNIILKQFYGPPNYGETPEIDKIESYYVLQLNEPITFTHGYITETVKEIQLIITDNKNIELNIDWNYIVTGNAFFAETGHHHTPIIIIVNMIIRDAGIF